jgi:hypothetical protein
MLRPQRNTQIPLRYRESSPPRIHRNNGHRKRPKIDPANVDRNNVDQALTVIAPASENAENAKNHQRSFQQNSLILKPITFEIELELLNIPVYLN